MTMVVTRKKKPPKARLVRRKALRLAALTSASMRARRLKLSGERPRKLTVRSRRVGKAEANDWVWEVKKGRRGKTRMAIRRRVRRKPVVTARRRWTFFLTRSSTAGERAEAKV